MGNLAAVINGTATAAVNLGAYSISGSVGAAGAGATVVLSGLLNASTTAAGGTGNYSFIGLAVGTYFITPGKAGIAFSPTSLPEVVSNASIVSVNFTTFTPIRTNPVIGTPFSVQIIG